jgi:hypothetical protein
MPVTTENSVYGVGASFAVLRFQWAAGVGCCWQRSLCLPRISSRSNSYRINNMQVNLLESA